MSKGSVKSEGGSGGKRGHSNMTHWDRTEEIKEESRHIRRRNDESESESGVSEYFTGRKVKNSSDGQ